MQVDAKHRFATLFRILRGLPATGGFTALDQIDLEVRRGQSLGIIGQNGAGKSTLLKMIAGVIAPSAGVVSVSGRVSALLELGTGFHPDYTGRENIHLAGAIMGLTREALSEREPDIIAFADIGRFIDEPIKHYSSGMVVRLGFAVATCVTPEVLITDEVMAVGDEAFQRKCIRWIEGYLAQGGTLLLCSHAMYHVQKLCQRAVWIQAGKIRRSGASADVTREYLADLEQTNASGVEISRPAKATESDTYRTENFEIVDDRGTPAPELPMGATLVARGTIHTPDGRAPNVAIGIVRPDGSSVFGTTNQIDGVPLTRISSHQFAFQVRFHALPLLPGRYHFRAHAMDPEALRVTDTEERQLTVTGTGLEMGIVRLPHDWEHNE
jgi:lipopolysaccharide transport system ATP-binding protein